MSKERELLERVISGDDAGDFFIGYRLYKDIETFLDQPEQENIYQKLLRIEERLDVEIFPSHLWLDGYETAIRNMQPEQEPVAWIIETEMYGKLIESICMEKKHYMEENDGPVQPIPLYTAPPKREPLSEEELDVLAEANITGEGIAGYYLGFRDAEKYHNIGVGNE